MATGAALAKFREFDDATALETLRSEVEAHLRGHGTSEEWAAMEDAVGAVLRCNGHRVRVTARSKDGGLDAILDHSTLGAVFVQVKHSKNRIGVETFRELVGTMLLEGARYALLVTSSKFTSGVEKLAHKAIERGTPVELVDGARFLSALDLQTRLRPPTISEVFAAAKPNVAIIDREIQL